MVRRLNLPHPCCSPLEPSCCKAAEAPNPADLQTGQPRAQALTSTDRPLTETLQMGDRASLYRWNKLQQSKRGEGRDGEQGYAFDDARDAAGASQQPRGKRQHRRDDELRKHEGGKGLAQPARPVRCCRPREAHQRKGQEQRSSRDRRRSDGKLEPEHKSDDCGGEHDEKRPKSRQSWSSRLLETRDQAQQQPMRRVTGCTEHHHAGLVRRRQPESDELHADTCEQQGERQPHKCAAKQSSRLLTNDRLDRAHSQEGQGDTCAEHRHDFELRAKRTSGQHRLGARRQHIAENTDQ